MYKNKCGRCGLVNRQDATECLRCFNKLLLYSRRSVSYEDPPTAGTSPVFRTLVTAVILSAGGFGLYRYALPGQSPEPKAEARRDNVKQRSMTRDEVKEHIERYQFEDRIRKEEKFLHVPPGQVGPPGVPVIVEPKGPVR